MRKKTAGEIRRIIKEPDERKETYKAYGKELEENKETIAAAADAGYASISDIAAAVRIGVEPHAAGTDCRICVPAAEGGQTEITRHDNGRCVYVKERNIALCPMGNVPYPGFYKESKGEAVFHNSEACKKCTGRCTKEDSRGFRYGFVMEKFIFTKNYNDRNIFIKQVHIKPKKEIYDQRKSLSEHPFGTIKRGMDGGYCLLKGKAKVSGEFSPRQMHERK